MPRSRRTNWLICYDIADPARLVRVHREVRRYATPFQHSVFRAHATRRGLAKRLRILAELIDPRQDDVRAYPLLTAAAPIVYGSRLLAEGVHFAFAGEDL